MFHILDVWMFKIWFTSDPSPGRWLKLFFEDEILKVDFLQKWVMNFCHSLFYMGSVEVI